jgi:hypothetical protein
MDLNHSPSMCWSGVVSSSTGFCIPAIICTQLRLMHIVLPSGELSLVCWMSAVTCAMDCSAYRCLIPIPPCSAGPYTTALAVFLLYLIFSKKITFALFSFFYNAFSFRYVATNGYVTPKIYNAFHASLASFLVMCAAPTAVPIVSLLLLVRFCCSA